MDFANLLNVEDTLSQLAWYCLNRLDNSGESQKVWICVHAVLGGEGKGRFYAEPTLLVRHSKAEFIGVGDSVEEALGDCLTKIKEIPFDQIIPR